jgi:thiosulfate reductase cytochrome b subunit
MVRNVYKCISNVNRVHTTVAIYIHTYIPMPSCMYRHSKRRFPAVFYILRSFLIERHEDNHVTNDRGQHTHCIWVYVLPLLCIVVSRMVEGHRRHTNWPLAGPMLNHSEDQRTPYQGQSQQAHRNISAKEAGLHLRANAMNSTWSAGERHILTCTWATTAAIPGASFGPA